ncbi:unnamed protein product [Triticum turgidum subsp. durum]|uniref:Uncharacterized protein n=1 Tax=Triticum turgidum subsp. durum TaxID=4567 RepID=A0A9R0Z584_TRITD|nr:unnamed protein product [Triticum turgidum subsp. durum]VAI71571.1 unnamed protein product [Triticum turgidum subsp. durum]
MRPSTTGGSEHVVWDAHGILGLQWQDGSAPRTGRSRNPINLDTIGRHLAGAGTARPPLLDELMQIGMEKTTRCVAVVYPTPPNPAARGGVPDKILSHVLFRRT